MVSTGEEAIQRADALHPDLVLMDIRLEGSMDGIQAAEAIRSRLDIPVIYLSAFADKQTVERAKVTEPFGYLIKPFEDSELHSTIEVALYKRKTEAQRRALETQLLQAQKMESIGTLVVGLAHNLNNILAIILGYSSRLERTMDDPAKISQSVTAINQAVRRGASLIQQLIGVTTKANLQFASVDVNALLQDLLRMVIEIFPAHHHVSPATGSCEPVRVGRSEPVASGPAEHPPERARRHAARRRSSSIGTTDDGRSGTQRTVPESG